MKKLVLIILLFFTSFGSQEASAQCAGYCGGYSPVGFCYCDDICWVFGDCCFADMCTSCPGIGPNTIANCGPPPPPPPPPCGTPITFNFTGGVQNWVVPAGVTTITIVANGAQGGGVAGANGGFGAQVTTTIPVTPGNTISMNIGGQGGCPGPGYNGGGLGYNSTDGVAAYGSCGGGGSSNVSLNGSLIIVAAGGGGAGGGSDAFNGGGAGGCANGVQGVNTYGVGGGGGSQTAGGIGGAPWAGTPPGGSNGSFGQGGNGGLWQTASGGGGGGGYYGGGGGGNDGCCTGANGGGGGGGGSSLVPGGGGCSQGVNTGNGSVTIYIPTPNTMTSTNTASICSGGVVNIPLTSTVAGSTFTWVATAQPNVTGESTTNQTTSTLNNTLTNTTTAVQTVNYTVTPSTPGCPGTPQTVTVTVNPPPVVTPEANLTYCAGAAVPANGFVSTPVGATFTWTNSNTAIGLAASGTGGLPAFTATNATAGPITATITVTPALGACVGPPINFTITINPQPVLVAEPNLTFCANAVVPLNSFASTPAGATFTWTNSNTGIGLGASGSGSIPAFGATNATAGPITATITVTPTIGTCVGAPSNFTITVNPLPTATPEPNLTFCAGDAVPINTLASTPAGATFTWTNSNTGIGLAANGSGNIPAFTATNATAGPITSTITATPTIGTCVGATINFTITVNPLPVVTPEANLTFCPGDAAPLNSFASTPAGATFAWTNSNTAIGLGASGTGSVPAFTATNATAGAIIGTITITPTLGTCVGPTSNYTITVSPQPVVTPEANLTFCAGAAVPANGFVSTPAGATFTWTNSNAAIGLAASGTGGLPAFTASNATAAAITSTISVTPTIGACVGLPINFTITISPLPIVTAEPNQTFCAGDAVPLNGFASTPAGSTFTWTNSNTAIGLAASGAGSVPAFTATNATATAITGTITISPTLATCVGPTSTYTITVNPQPVATPEVNLTYCAGAAVPANAFASTPAGATFTWTNSNAAIGLAASGTGGLPAFTATNAGAVPITSTITVTPTLGTCVGTPINFTITINPLPTFTVTSTNPTVCGGSDGTITINGLNATTNYNITYTGTGVVGPTAMMSNGAGSIVITGLSGGSYSGITVELATCSTTSPTILTLSDPNPPVVGAGPDQTVCQGTAVTLTATNPSGAIITWNNGVTDGVAFVPAVGTITYTVTANLAGCISTDQVDVTVNPMPTVVDPVDQVLCANSTTTAVNFTGLVPGTTYNWTNTTASIGLPVTGSGNIAAFNAINAGAAPVVATITVTPTATGCTGTPQTFSITVNPIPTVVDPADQVLCANTNIAAVNFVGAVAGTTFNWTNSATSIGLPASGSGNIASFNTVNTGTTPVVATITVTPISAGCTGTSQTFTITVNPTPTVVDPADQALCANTNTTAINFTGAIAGTAYNWTNSASSIGLAGAGSGNISAFNAINTGNTPVVATISVTPTINGCTGTPQTFTITVNGIPTVNAGPDQVVCDGIMTTLTANNPDGAAISWNNGVNDGVAFNQPVGSVNYTVTATLLGCASTDNVNVTVNPSPIINAGVDQIVCEGTLTTLSGTGAGPGGTYVWDNGAVNNAPFTQAIGTITYTLTGTNSSGCVSTDQTTITVNPMPAVAFDADVLMGCAPLAVNFNNLTLPLGTSCQWNFGDGNSSSGCGTVANTYNNPGAYNVSLTVTTAAGCTASVTYNAYIFIENEAVASFIYSPTSISVENTAVQFENTSEYADTYVWNFGYGGMGSNQTDPSHTFPVIGNVSYTIKLIASNAAGCIDSIEQIITIEDQLLFFVPNVFTPDGNDINNNFLPVFTSGYDVYDYHLTIFDRWGEVLFESYNATGGWNGTYGNQGLVDDGVYVWQIEFGETMSDKRHTHRGHVTVLK